MVAGRRAGRLVGHAGREALVKGAWRDCVRLLSFVARGVQSAACSCHRARNKMCSRSHLRLRVVKRTHCMFVAAKYKQPAALVRGDVAAVVVAVVVAAAVVVAVGQQQMCTPERPCGRPGRRPETTTHMMWSSLEIPRVVATRSCDSIRRVGPACSRHANSRLLQQQQ